MNTWTDEELREGLRGIDQDEDVTVSEWEADFIENVLYRYLGPLSPRQRETADRIIETYDRRD